MGRPRRTLGELGAVSYTVEPSGLVVARGRVYDGGGKEQRPNGSGRSEAEALAALKDRRKTLNPQLGPEKPCSNGSGSIASAVTVIVGR